jgi:hypothetical protein
MTTAEFGAMSERDIAIRTATKIEAIDEKLDKVCSRQDDHESRLKTIEIEHQERSGSCGTNEKIPKNQPRKLDSTARLIIGIASAGAFVGGIIAAVIDYFLKYPK